MAAHQLGDAVLAHGYALLLQLSIHSGAAVGAAAGLMHLFDALHQDVVFLCTPTGAAIKPGIEAGTGDTLHTTHHGDRQFSPVHFDEFEDFRFRSEVNRMAFFRSSCACCSTLYFFSSQIAQPLEFGDGLVIQLDTLGHDQSLPSVFSPA